jgi:flavin reductase (DIM6/NTAB) family NADH-FMN oxidoreductase RutF
MSARANLPEEFNQALRKFTYGFYILTTRKKAEELSQRSEDYIAAGTVSWVSQVSFTPPLVMVAVQKQSDLNETISKSRVFALNFIGSANQQLIEAFGGKTTVSDDALNGFTFENGATGSPLISACPLAIECHLLDAIHTHGDHVLFIGRVDSVTIRDENAKLVTDQEIGHVYGGTK